MWSSIKIRPSFLKTGLVLITAMLACVSMTAGWCDSSSGTPQTGPKSESGNFVGSLRHALQVAWTDTDGTAHYACIPPGTRVVVHATAANSTDATLYLDTNIGPFGKIEEPVVADCAAAPASESPSSQSAVPIPMVDPTRVYKTSIDNINSTMDYQQYVLGVMAVPFKYYWQGDKTFTGNTTLAGYFGNRFHNADRGLDITAAIFAGATTVSVPSTGAGTASQSVSGFSVGFSEFFTIGGSTQAGWVIGKDYVSSSANWNNNGRTWISIDIAYQFL